MFYQIIQYLKFLLKSTNQHGVHSPFVYNLVTQCLYDTSKYEAYKHITAYRKQLLQNKTKINMTDLGAGSNITKLRKRKVSEIARNAGTTMKRAKGLYRVVTYFKPNNILELGTSLGMATQAMSLGNPKAKITTIEGCQHMATIAKSNFEKHQLNNINVVVGHFDVEIKELPSHTYDLIFFDGNHQKNATLLYFETLLKTAHNDSVFIFDDIYWSKGMTQAWETIKQHPQVTVTIDTYFWGFVFFRKEQAKEHFVIRW